MSGDAVFRRNWWGIGIALLVILAIAAVIATVAALLTTGIGGVDPRMTPFSLNEVFFKNLSGVDNQIHWVQDSVLSFIDENRSIWMLNSTAEGEPKRSQLLPFDSYKSSLATSYVVAPSLRYVAIFYSQQKVYRHSFFSLINIRSLKQDLMNSNNVKAPAYFATLFQPHMEKNEEIPVGPKKNGREMLSLFAWSPAASADDFAFVYENNIYYQRSVKAKAEMITKTGTFNMYNGVADWLYEEEILNSHVALWWSESGENLAFASFNDSEVKNVTMGYYEESERYPEQQVIPYTKVNETLPRVSLFVWNKASKALKQIRPPDVVVTWKEYYLLRVNWLKHGDLSSWLVEGEKFVATWTSRAQNQLYVSLCSTAADQCILNYVQNYTDYWVEPNAGSVQFSNADSYFALLPHWQSAYDGFFSHVAAVIVPNNGLFGRRRFVTSGAFEVTQIVGYNEETNQIFFIAALPLPRNRNLYSMNVSDPDPTSMECLTCALAEENCTYVSAVFSPDSSHYVLYCLGPGIPRTLLFSLQRNVTVIEDNAALREYLRFKQFPTVQYKDIDVDDKFTAAVKLILPPTFDDSPARDVRPVVLRVYAGPNSQSVLDTWPLMEQKSLFDAFLATTRQYIVVYIDGRGAACHGSNYLKAIYGNLGKTEIDDQLAVFKILQQLNFFDWRKTAVWGWSYGGFATARIVQEDAFRVFTCATSVAPVTKFDLYDATYTERYMGLYTPSNVLRYENTDVTKNVSAFARGSYLLVHGSLDDNVHFQNSALLIKALTEKNVQFQFMMYTNSDHSLNNNTYHFFTMLDNFWMHCFHTNSLAT